MTTEHTPGPWINDDGLILPHGFDDADDARYQAWIAEAKKTVDARRIVACVNACEGIPDAMLTNIADWRPLLAERNRLAALVEEMVGALNSTMSGLEAWMEIAEPHDRREYDDYAIAQARAVLAKVKP